MVCWCETNEKDKTKAVKEAEAKDIELGSEIEARSARFGELGTSITQLKKGIQANADTLGKATAIREGEAAKFREEEADMVQCVTNLRNAVTVLSKHQGASSMLQLDASLLSGMRILLRDAALKYDMLVAGRMERRGRSTLALLQEEHPDQQSAALLHALNVHGDAVSTSLPVKFAARVVADAAGSSDAKGASQFLQRGSRQPIFESRSSARSSGIFGVLQQMQSEFEEELSTSQEEELKAVDDFKALAAAKSSEIEAGKKKLDEMEVEHANNQKALSDAKEDLGLTRQQRSEDVEFLRTLKLSCNDLDSQWEQRSKTRSAETTAVAETISILTEYDNREHLTKTVALLQEGTVSSSEASARRLGAASILRRAAQSPAFDTSDLMSEWNSHKAGTGAVAAAARFATGPRAQFSTLATAVQLDAFAKVKQLMENMIADLKDQQAEEVKFKDHCNEELGSAEKTLYEKGERRKDLEANIDDLANVMRKLQDEIDGAKAQISEAQAEIKTAGQRREDEYKEFQAVVADQRATQSILQKALGKLKDFYHKGIGQASFVQSGAKQKPPAKFNAYQSNAGSNSVVGLIEQIIEDSRALEAEASAGERAAQASYEQFVRDSNVLLGGLREAAVTKTRNSAAAKGDKATAGADLESTTGELESLTVYQSDLHGRCDFVLKNFNARQKARLQEIEAIQGAKAILAGSK